MPVTRRLPDFLEGWLAYQENSEAPILYSYWTAVSLVSSALSRKCYHTWEKQIFPNFFILLIGPPGFRKGTAMGPGSRFLSEIGMDTTPDSSTRAQLIALLEEAIQPITYEDGTSDHYSPLAVFSEEFTVFLGKENLQLMMDLCDWFDCKEQWKYSTKGSGKYFVKGVYVTLMGATTPMLFQSALPESAVGSGLLSRIICVFEDVKSQVVIFPHKLKNKHPTIEPDLKHDFEAIKMMKGEFSFDPEFDALYEKWYPVQHETAAISHERLQPYKERRPTHLRKLAMISSASRSNEMIITAEDFNRSLALLQLTEKKMDKAFSGMGQSDTSNVMQKIAEFIAVKGEVLYSDVMKRFMLDADKQMMSVILATLIEGKVVEKINIEGEYGDYILKWKEEEKENGGS